MQNVCSQQPVLCLIVIGLTSLLQLYGLNPDKAVTCLEYIHRQADDYSRPSQKEDPGTAA